MKKFVVLIVIAVTFMACKKDQTSSLQNSSVLTTDSATLKTNINSLTTEVVPLTVQTIAGMPGNGSFNDGQGNQARFYTPTGIQLMDDGTLYVADLNNSRIRKITPSGFVSTVNFPNDNNGQPLRLPLDMGVAPDGTINVVAYSGTSTFGKVWIVKPNGKVYTTKLAIYRHSDIEKDLNGKFWFSDGLVLRKMEINSKGQIGTDSISFPSSKLLSPESADNGTRVTWNFRFAFNAVIYLLPDFTARTGGPKPTHIYKHTPSGVNSQAMNGVTLSFGTSITSNKDSRTFYFVSGGSIYSLSNGKLKFLVGRNITFPDGRDGVGSQADVNASALALSKNEKILFFTDGRNTVRKLILAR